MPKIKYYWQIKQALEKQALKWVNKALEFLKEDIDKKTPEDTKTLLKNNKIQQATSWGWLISWSVYNDAPYAWFVEYWVKWWWYNFHKPKWNIFYVAPAWEGAAMFRRATDEKRDEVNNIIKKAVNG